MSENKYDKLLCGNCGYDGGKSHLEEKLKWQEALSKSNSVTPDVRSARAWAAAIAVCFISIVAGMTTYAVWPEPPQPVKPVPTSLQLTTEAYQACLETIKGSDNRKELIEICNKQFAQEELK